MRIHVIFHMTKFANIEMEEESQFFSMMIFRADGEGKKLGKWETHSHE